MKTQTDKATARPSIIFDRLTDDQILNSVRNLPDVNLSLVMGKHNSARLKAQAMRWEAERMMRQANEELYESISEDWTQQQIHAAIAKATA